MRRRIERVVDGHAPRGAEPLIRIDHGRPAALGEHHVEIGQRARDREHEHYRQQGFRHCSDSPRGFAAIVADENTCTARVLVIPAKAGTQRLPRRLGRAAA
jgi:hypothetical protein